MPTNKVSHTRLAHRVIKAHRREFSTQTMYDVLHVAPSGYFAWLQPPQSDRAIEDAHLLRLIRASFTTSNGIYGARRVSLDLRERGDT